MNNKVYKTVDKSLKRDRCINWEKEGTHLLRHILRPYVGIIENKDLTTNTNKAKAVAWAKITEKYDSITYIHRFNAADMRNRTKNQVNMDIQSNVIEEDEKVSRVNVCPSTSNLPSSMPKRSAKKTVTKEPFNFGEDSFADMHTFRVLENERLQKEHELRMQNMAESHNQVMANLTLQQEILLQNLECININV